MSQYLLNCDADRSGVNCTMTTYQPGPPPTENGFQHNTLLMGLWISLAVLVVLIGATAAVRWKAHQERNETQRERLRNERTRIEHPPSKCPVCGITNDVPETVER